MTKKNKNFLIISYLLLLLTSNLFAPAGTVGENRIRISSPVEIPILTQRFSMEREHFGVDLISRNSNKEVRAIVNCFITEIYTGFTPHIICKNLESGYEYKYMHTGNWRHKVGEYVKSGEVLGEYNNEGLSIGAHLHLEILKQKQYFNPITFF